MADGTGKPLRTADIGITGGTITAVGQIAAGRGAREIDADGALVTPGWVDVHTHYDGQATWDSHLAPSSWHGVTTVVFGNCGVGFAPVHVGDRETLVALMEGVEDIPGTALHEGLPWTWETFPEYLDALESIPHDIDFATQVPHGALRVQVMGDRGVRREPATADDIAAMAALARQGVEAGALGFSTSRTVNHKSSNGQHTPSLTASAAELAGIAEGLRAAGRGVLQVVSDFFVPMDADPALALDEEWGVVRGMAESSGRPLSFSLVHAPVVPGAQRRTVPYEHLLARVDEARADGLAITAQASPRAIGLILGLSATLHPFMTNRVFAEIAGRPLAEQVTALRDPTFRARLLEAHTGEIERKKLGGVVIAKFDGMFPLADPPDYEPGPEDSVAARARASGRTAEETALDLMLVDGGRGLLYTPLINYIDGNLDAVREMLTHRWAVPGLSDGGAHVGTICDVSFPSFMLAYWGRQRPTGRLPVEWLVERHTRATARLVGLEDRGLLAPGYRADVNVIDFEHLVVRRPEIHADLPAGGRRLLQRADGYLHTFVAGQETYRDGVATGELPGRLIRGAQPAPT